MTLYARLHTGDHATLVIKYIRPWGMNMERCLILSNAFDIHTYAVKWAIERLGAAADVWVLPDFPSIQCSSLLEDKNNDEDTWVIRGPNADLHKNNNYKTVWLRRVPYTFPVDDKLHPADVDIVQRESRHFIKGTLNTILSGAFWVNPVWAHEASQYKILQTRKAKEVGLNIPNTLYSNDPCEIEKFIKSNNGVVLKSFLPIGWHKKENLYRLWTTPISLNQIYDARNSITKCCSIYQSAIDKAFEVRLTIMGNTFFAAKIESQKIDSLHNDWRQSPADLKALKFPYIEIPLDIKEKCKDLIKKLNLVFGCIDFIVTPDNKYVFLEINEMGQFLFIEHYNRKIPMLQAFTLFLISRNPEFMFESEVDKDISFEKFYESDTYQKKFKMLEKEHRYYNPDLFPDDEMRI